MRGHAGIFQGVRRLASRRDREREQESLGADKLVTGLFAGLFCRIKDLGRRCSQVEFFGPATFHLGKRRQCQIGLADCHVGFAARSRDQIAGQTRLVVEQGFEHMFGRELLVAFANCQRLRRLNDRPRTVGVAFYIHRFPIPWKVSEIMAVQVLCKPLSGPVHNGNRCDLYVTQVAGTRLLSVD